MASPPLSTTISVWIGRDPREVYDFLAVPENFPPWASGLGTSLRREGDGWIAQTRAGAMKVRFSPRNDFGVVDHYVCPPGAPEIYVPMRVLASGAGSEVALTLFRQPGMSDEQFAADAKWVETDLHALKRLLEG